MTTNIIQDETIKDEYTGESVERSSMEQLGDEATAVAVKQVETSAKARQLRFNDIAKNEDQYNGVNSPAVLKGRSDIPFDTVVARGFTDTLLSKIDEPLSIQFARSKEQNKSSAEKMTSAIEKESAPDRGAWSIKDLGSKKLAIFSGRGIIAKYSDRDDNGKFKDYFEVVDHWDFLTEPKGGGNLDKHLFKGQLNIFMDYSQLKKGPYNQKQVAKLVNKTSDDQCKKNEDLYKFKVSRLQTNGIDFEENTFVGSRLYRLTKWVMKFRGEWYYIVFDYSTGIWIRFEKLEKVFSVAKKYDGRGPWISWATNSDPFEFWSTAPMDSIRAIAFAMKKVVNGTLDNIEKRNWDMKAYNPAVFREPRKLLYKKDGLVKAYLKRGESINNHIFNFETPDTTNISINLVDYLNAFLGEKTGITAGAQGKAEEDKVGIFFGNMQQVADRLGLTNKMYEQAHTDIGVNFQWGLHDHAPEKYIVKLIGNSGISWDETLTRDESALDFNINVSGGNAEAQANQIKNEQKKGALQMIQVDPILRQSVNPKWYLEQVLSGVGGYDKEEVRVALDTQNDADDDILAEASQSIEDIITGKKPKKNRGATTGFIQKIIDYAYNEETLSEELFDKLVKYAQSHLEIAKQNAIRKARGVLMNQGLPVGNTGAPKNIQNTAPNQSLGVDNNV